MKLNKIFFCVATVFAATSCDVVKSVATDAVTSELGNLGTTNAKEPSLSMTEAAIGLKEALVNGVVSGTDILGKVGAFSNNAAIKIPLPPEVQSVEKKIRDNYLLNKLIGAELDKAVTAMNQGAEKSMSLAVPVFKKAITDMTFTDAMKILTGGSGAATSYLKTSTQSALISAFKPEVQKALDEVSLTKIWTPVVTKINENKKILGLAADIQPDLNQYVAEHATAALFTEIEKQENTIRKDPVARTSDILKKAFDYAEKH